MSDHSAGPGSLNGKFYSRSCHYDSTIMAIVPTINTTKRMHRIKISSFISTPNTVQRIVRNFYGSFYTHTLGVLKGYSMFFLGYWGCGRNHRDHVWPCFLSDSCRVLFVML